jgi:HSP20 family protein
LTIVNGALFYAERMAILRQQRRFYMDAAYMMIEELRNAHHGMDRYVPFEVVDDNGMMLSLDMPGHDPSNIDIQIEDRLLKIKSTRKHIDGRKRNFNVSHIIKFGFDLEHIKAEAKNGVLTIRIPRSTDTTPRKITVHT